MNCFRITLNLNPICVRDVNVTDAVRTVNLCVATDAGVTSPDAPSTIVTVISSRFIVQAQRHGNLVFSLAHKMLTTFTFRPNVKSVDEHKAIFYEHGDFGRLKEHQKHFANICTSDSPVCP
jgi:hypothetical protein